MNLANIVCQRSQIHPSGWQPQVLPAKSVPYYVSFIPSQAAGNVKVNLESIFEGMDLGKSFESPD